MGTLRYRKVKQVLNFRETKPTVYKMRQLTYPVIKEEALLEYITNSAHIPASTLRACVTGMAQAIAYFVINGHRVCFDRFGSFYLGVKQKYVQSAEDLKLDNLRRVRIMFAASDKMRKLMAQVNLEHYESLSVEEDDDEETPEP